MLCIYRAAYQYGVKMNDGRKTRSKAGGGAGKSEKDEKQKLDKQWNQISKVVPNVVCKYLVFISVIIIE